METKETNGKSVASLVLGIIAVIVPYIGIILGIIGLVLANKGIKEIAVTGQGGRGLAVAGRVTSIIGIVFGAILLFFLILSLAILSSDPYYGY
ncbi:DUF4190 domain-containing protein [Ornithinibacillus contaminans]|uniref:DUF4190 domain-containing protein n=1 Tax=Ornithinibacillus contaminans TaxID=694055 RepID=UPI0009F84683|nr:DUF4190 domain-containing protein [Ornithinibacillus contaminans]